jgi:hypothetical protein
MSMCTETLFKNRSADCGHFSELVGNENCARCRASYLGLSFALLFHAQRRSVRTGPEYGNLAVRAGWVDFSARNLSGADLPCERVPLFTTCSGTEPSSNVLSSSVTEWSTRRLRVVTISTWLP